jgi:hypothetical protein
MMAFKGAHRQISLLYAGQCSGWCLGTPRAQLATEEEHAYRGRLAEAE